jgi:hypothetical protein
VVGPRPLSPRERANDPYRLTERPTASTAGTVDAGNPLAADRPGAGRVVAM